MSASNATLSPETLARLVALSNGGILRPSPTLGVRLIVLSCFLGSLPLLSAILLSLHVVATHRKGERVFLWKRVKRGNGSYIVGSRTVLLGLMALFVFGTLGGSTYFGWRFFGGNLSYGTFNYQICTFLFWAIYYVFAWSFTSANFATWALVAPEGRWKPSPRRSNTLFIVPLVLGETILISICIFGVLKTKRFFDGQTPLLDALADRNATIDFVKLIPLINAYFSAADTYFNLMQKLQIAFIASVFPLLIVNVSAVAVWVTLRRHRKDAEHLARSGLVERASEEGDPYLCGKALKGVERVFMVDAVAILVWSAAILVHQGWVISIFPTITTADWETIETTFFVQPWLGSAPLAIALLAQIIIAWHHLPPRVSSSQHDAEAPHVTLPSFVLPSSPRPLAGKRSSSSVSLEISVGKNEEVMEEKAEVKQVESKMDKEN